MIPNGTITSKKKTVIDFLDISKQSNVRYFTGLKSYKVFENLLTFLSRKPCNMRYWYGTKLAKTTSRIYEKRIKAVMNSPEFNIEPLMFEKLY